MLTPCLLCLFAPAPYALSQQPPKHPTQNVSAKPARRAPSKPVSRPSAPATPPRSQSTGVALAVGLGTGFGAGFGVQVAVPVALFGGIVQVGPYAGIGFLPGVQEATAVVAPSFGVLGFWGIRHRLFVDLDFGPPVVRYWQLHGTTVAQQPVYGPSALVGYEFMAHHGMFVRTGIGAGFPMLREANVTFTASVAWGWKL
jgi:hypothetical protein